MNGGLGEQGGPGGLLIGGPGGPGGLMIGGFGGHGGLGRLGGLMIGGLGGLGGLGGFGGLGGLMMGGQGFLIGFGFGFGFGFSFLQMFLNGLHTLLTLYFLQPPFHPHFFLQHPHSRVDQISKVRARRENNLIENIMF